MTSPPATAPARGGSPSLAHPDYWWYRARSRLLQVALAPYVEAADRLLDVGSADGPSVGWLAGVASTAVSMDLDPRGLRAPYGVCGSVLELPFRDDCFDVVTAFDVIEHCDPEEQVVGELRRVLVPGGRLLVSVPAYQWAWSDHDTANGHVRRYTRARAVRTLERQGFTVLRASYAFTSVFPFFAAERLLRRASRAHRRTTTADVVTVPEVSPATERLLLGLTRLDERLLGSRDLPFGSSVLLAAVRS